MRALFLLVLGLCAAAPASAQLVQPLRVDLAAGTGLSVGPEVGRIAFQGTADLQFGAPTLRFRGLHIVPMLDAETRWEGAALAGATFHAPEATFFLGAGPARYQESVSNRIGVESETGWGLAVSADAYYALSGTTRIGVQGFGTFGGASVQGATASIRFGR